MTSGERRANGLHTVAVLGAGGTMGFPIARNLARAGFAVRAWNRTRAKAQPLAADGADVLDSPAEAVRGADAIITMLADTDAVLAAMSGEEPERDGAEGDSAAGAGALAAAGRSAIWVQMSTVGERGTERCAELARAHGVAFVDAPVLGTRQPADERKLVILGSGPEELRERLLPLFSALGQRPMWVGAAGAGTRLKLVTNAWILIVVEGGAETIALAEGLGVDPALFFQALEGGTLDLPYLRIKGRAIAARDFTPSFRLALAAKDAALVAAAADERNLDLPLHRAVAARLRKGVEAHGDEDMSATYLTSAPTPASGPAPGFPGAARG